MSQKCPKCGCTKIYDFDCPSCGSLGYIYDDNDEEDCEECEGQGYIEGQNECSKCGYVDDEEEFED
ncbi:MAG: hypothetical protein GY749_22825 [Desulfobacteraceae bacterium]|nr:hypothetical protein [Desulfobacteraceae bacterium]